MGPNADPFVFGIFSNFLLLIGWRVLAPRGIDLDVNLLGKAATWALLALAIAACCWAAMAWALAACTAL